MSPNSRQTTYIYFSVSGDCGWFNLRRSFPDEMRPKVKHEGVPLMNHNYIKNLLDERGVPYQSYELPSALDITTCFIEGDENGELLLDFLTEKVNFSKMAPPELKQRVLRQMRDPECSVEKDGKVLFNVNQGMIILGALN